MRIPRTAAFYLLASIIVTFLAGSSAPTPLYAVYQAAWGFAPLTITIVFGIYALAVLGALLVTGSLSDHVGRRPVLIIAALAQTIAMIVFATATGVTALVVARIIQGLATGFASSAVGAAMLDLDRERGATANAVGPMVGTGTGSVLSGLLVQFLPAPTHLVYIVLAIVFVVQAFGVLLIDETVARKPGALASLRPRFRIPAAARPALWTAIPALVAIWAFVGLYGALGPSIVHTFAGGGSRMIGGLVLFTFAAGGVAAVFAFMRRPAHMLLQVGTLTLVVGIVFTLAVILAESVAGFFVGTAIVGMGFGATFQGAIRSTVASVAAHERAGVLSIIYVISYLSFGIPAVIAGLRVAQVGVITTALEYSVGVLVLATVALLGTLARRAPVAAAVMSK